MTLAFTTQFKLYFRQTKARKMRWAGHAARTEGVRNSPKNSVRIPERKSLKTYEQVVG
jgi:light-regulated signal transduction histidine kinase (bacteriophytochrome)